MASKTIHECLKNHFVYLINEDISFMEQVKHGKFTQIHKKKKVMMLAMLLIEVFERTSNSTEEYLQLQQLDVRRKHVEKYIALKLVEAGFDLKAGHLDFSSQDRFISYDSPTKYIETQLDKLSQSWSPGLPMLQQTNVFYSPKVRKYLLHFFTVIFIVSCCWVFCYLDALCHSSQFFSPSIFPCKACSRKTEKEKSEVTK